MNRRMTGRLGRAAWLLMAPILAAAPFARAWEPRDWTDKYPLTYSPPGRAVSVALPDGWTLNSKADRLQMTRDSPNLQQIRMLELDPRFVYNGSKMTVTPATSPEQLSAVLLEDFIVGSRGIKDVTVVEAVEVSVCGQKGLRQVVTYLSSAQHGLSYRHELYAWVKNGKLYYLDYDAPALYFFDRDRGAFDKIVRSCN